MERQVHVFARFPLRWTITMTEGRNDKAIDSLPRQQEAQPTVYHQRHVDWRGQQRRVVSRARRVALQQAFRTMKEEGAGQASQSVSRLMSTMTCFVGKERHNSPLFRPLKSQGFEPFLAFPPWETCTKV